MRKRATEGTKISTSLTITKKMVRTSRRADKLLSSTTSLASAEPRQQPDEPAGTRGEQPRSIIASGRSLARLTSRRVGHDQIGHRADLEPLRDRQRPRQDQIAGPGAEDRGAKDAAIATGDDLDQALSLALGLSPVVLGKTPTQHARGPLDGARRGFGQSDLGEFGIGIGDPGQCPVIDLGRDAEQRVADHDAGMIEGDVGKLRPAGDVADGKGPAVCRAQLCIDGNTLCGRSNSGRREIERLDRRAPSRGDQQMRARDLLAARKANADDLSVALDAGDLDPRVRRDPFAAKPLGESRGELDVVARKKRADIEHGDPRTEPAMGLRHLDPDRSAADDDQMLGQFAVGKDALVGQIGDTIEPAYRRYRRLRAGRDHKPPRPNFDLAGTRRAGARETRLGTQHPDAEPFEALDRIVRRDGGDHLLDTVADGGEIDPRLSVSDAEGGTAAPEIREPRRGEQRLRGHAAKVQAIATHGTTLDQHDLGTHLCGAGGDRQPARSGPYDAKIGCQDPGHAVLLPRQRLYPTGINARMASPTIGTSTLGRKTILGSGSATTLPSPLPRLA